MTGVAVGDRVVSSSPAGGGYATQAVVPSAAVIKLPEGFDFSVAAGLLVQGMTAYFMLRGANLAAGETVLATGAAGGVGSMAVQMARAQGAKVIGLASKAKHDHVMQNGAFAAVDYTGPGWSKQVLDLTAGEGIDVYLDAERKFGGEAYETLARKARWVVYGIQTDKPSALPLDKQWDYIFRNVSLRGYTIDTDFGNVPTGMRQAIEWVQRGELKVAVTHPLSTSYFPAQNSSVEVTRDRLKATQ